MKMDFKKHDLWDADRFSIADSLKTGAQTATTAGPESIYESCSRVSLGKRSPKKADWVTLQVQEAEQREEETGNQYSEKAFMVNQLFGSDISNARVVKLAVRLIDHAAPISEEEWEALSPLDRLVLAHYLGSVFGLRVQPDLGLDNPCSLNQLLTLRLKGRRNEERLNKTAKRVNAMMARSFVDLNQLAHLDEDQLAAVLHTAYFGEQSTEENIFASGTGFSQKSFGRAVETARYAEDFETLLKSSYITEILKSRHSKVLKEVKWLKKNLQEGRDPANQAEHNKRPPWLLEDIIEGAKLCQNIIDRSKIS